MQTQIERELERRAKAAKSQAQAARELGISRQHFNDVLKRRRRPGAELLLALGYEEVLAYKRTNGKS